LITITNSLVRENINIFDSEHQQQSSTPRNNPSATMCAPSNDAAQPMHAMIYRGKMASENCPESVGHLFKSTFPKVKVTYAGPDEKVKINADTLSQVDVFAYPGGPGMWSRHTNSQRKHTQELTNTNHKTSTKHGKKLNTTHPLSVTSYQTVVATSASA
jgi:hypothetical protein